MSQTFAGQPGEAVRTPRDPEVLRALSELQDAVYVRDLEGRYLMANAAAAAAVGRTPDEIVGRTDAELLGGEEGEAIRSADQEVISRGVSQSFEEAIVVGGELRTFMSTKAPLRDATGDVVGVVGVSTDISSRKEAEDDLRRDLGEARYEALRDPLTGLANRNLVLDRLEHALALAQRSRADVAVLFVDVDSFKWINDTMGHAAGDRLLEAVARLLKSAVRESDTVGRIGGDEFLILCEEVPGPLKAMELAERVRGHFRSWPAEQRPTAEAITASIGISTAGRRAVSPGDLVREADSAMYRAKSRGPGEIEVYLPAISSRSSASS
jgi:diguanylate cyclase (GGDEF)-like protein/PAS domain S-box-containing protein